MSCQWTNLVGCVEICADEIYSPGLWELLTPENDRNIYQQWEVYRDLGAGFILLCAFNSWLNNSGDSIRIKRLNDARNGDAHCRHDRLRQLRVCLLFTAELGV